MTWKKGISENVHVCVCVFVKVCPCSPRTFKQCMRKNAALFLKDFINLCHPKRFYFLFPHQTLECSIEGIYLSDHEVLITFLSLNNTSALKMWSLGNSWLKVSEFRDYLRQQIFLLFGIEWGICCLTIGFVGYSQDNHKRADHFVHYGKEKRPLLVIMRLGRVYWGPEKILLND